MEKRRKHLSEEHKRKIGEANRIAVKKYYDLELIAEKYHNMLTGAFAQK